MIRSEPDRSRTFHSAWSVKPAYCLDQFLCNLIVPLDHRVQVYGQQLPFLHHYLPVDDRQIDMLRRAGFVHEGTLRQHIRWDGAYVDVEMFGLLEDEWPGYAKKIEGVELTASDLEAKPKPEKKNDKDEEKK